MHGVPRNDIVVSIGLEAIVSLFYWRFYHVAFARVNSKRDFRLLKETEEQIDCVSRE